MDDRILAAVMPAPRQPIEIREFRRPDLPPGGALLRTERSEVCGTDVHLFHGRLAGDAEAMRIPKALVDPWAV